MSELENKDEVLDVIYNKVLPAIADVRSDVRDSNTRQELLSNRVNENTKEIKAHREALYGNGKTGLIRMTESIKEWVDSRRWYERILAVAIVGETIAIIFTLIAK